MTPDLLNLLKLALSEFSDIVVHAEIFRAKLRLFIKDKSYLDFWWSEVQAGRFAHHWDRRKIDGSIFRHDNSPHQRWRHVASFPRHFHKSSDDCVEESQMPQAPSEAVRFFLEFCRNYLTKESSSS